MKIKTDKFYSWLAFNMGILLYTALWWLLFLDNRIISTPKLLLFIYAAFMAAGIFGKIGVWIYQKLFRLASRKT